MIMKKLIYKLFAIVLVILASVGCDNFLEEEPKALLSPDDFFNSEAEADLAVFGLYSSFMLKFDNPYNCRGLETYYMNGADEVGPSRQVPFKGVIGDYVITEANAPLALWRALFRIVQDANLILDNVEGNEAIRPDARDRAIGEVLFGRALAYYHLTNLWGDVPYYRESLPLSEVGVLGRTDVNQIRNDMINDLQQAQDLLPDSYSGNDSGRATRWAAATLNVKINLWLQNWQAARDKAVEIINNSPHSLLDSYADVFDATLIDHRTLGGLHDNEEIIFQFDFKKDEGNLSQCNGDDYSPRLRDEPADPTRQSEFAAAMAEFDEGFTGFGLAVPLPDFINKFPTDDLRRPYNIIENYLGFDLNFPYMPKKWELDQTNSPRNNHGGNYIVFRLADVYLMAAEAENELNGPTNAYQYINRVRERAYEPDKPLSGLTQPEFRQAVYDERKWELAGEGHRRMDLIRWGILLDVVQNTEYRVFDPAANIQPRHVLLPIPTQELELNPNLLESDPTNNGYR